MTVLRQLLGGLGALILLLLGALIVLLVLVLAVSNLDPISRPVAAAELSPAESSRFVAASLGFLTASSPWLLPLLVPVVIPRFGRGDLVVRTVAMIALALLGLALSYASGVDPGGKGTAPTLDTRLARVPGYFPGTAWAYGMLVLLIAAVVWAGNRWPKGGAATLPARLKAAGLPAGAWLGLAALIAVGVATH